MTIRYVLAAPMEYGQENTPIPEQIQNEKEWWICTDWPGPEEDNTYTFIVYKSNWKIVAGYRGPPDKTNYLHIGSVIRDSASVMPIGKVISVEVITNMFSSDTEHRYLLSPVLEPQ